MLDVYYFSGLRFDEANDPPTYLLIAFSNEFSSGACRSNAHDDFSCLLNVPKRYYLHLFTEWAMSENDCELPLLLGYYITGQRPCIQ